jgi:hypothetical protein
MKLHAERLIQSRHRNLYLRIYLRGLLSLCLHLSTSFLRGPLPRLSILQNEAPGIHKSVLFQVRMPWERTAAQRQAPLCVMIRCLSLTLICIELPPGHLTYREILARYTLVPGERPKEATCTEG